MENVNLLNQEDKVFFAGCLKSLILSDGSIDDLEITDLHELTDKLFFDSFESYLEIFEDRVKTIETFWEMAENITNADVQNLIISSLHEIMLKDHIPVTHDVKLIEDLEQIWA